MANIIFLDFWNDYFFHSLVASRTMRLLTLAVSWVAASAFQPWKVAPAALVPPSVIKSQKATAASPTDRQEKIDSPAWVMATHVIPAVLACTIALSTTLSAPALAFDDGSVLNHDYADPMHPFCNRKIVANPDGKTFHYSGTRAVGPNENDNDSTQAMLGCSMEERKMFTILNEEFDGQISADNRLTVQGAEGVWEPKNTAKTQLGFEDVDGIRWNDGNKWIVQSQSYIAKDADGNAVVTKKPLSVIVGEWIFYSYIGFSTLAGAKGLYDGLQRKQQNAQ